jgi:copper chaperone CopZ
MNAQMKEHEQTRRATLPLYNLSCSSGDALTVEHILGRQSGVIEVYANPVTEMAYVKYDPALTNEDQLAAIIKSVGYGPAKG